MKHDPLEPLKQAGVSASPTFSESLHDRLMHDIRRASARQRTPHPRRINWTWAIPLATAAVITIALFWPRTPPAPPPKSIALTPQSLEPIRDFEQLLRQTTDKVAESRYAYLDRDGRRLLTFLMSHVPSLPPTHPKAHNTES